MSGEEEMEDHEEGEREGRSLIDASPLFPLFFSSKPNLNSAPINELQSPLFPYIDALYRSPDMILTPFDGKFDEKKDETPPGICRPHLLKNIQYWEFER